MDLRACNAADVCVERDSQAPGAPPLLPVADASTLASRVDGALLVSRTGVTNRGLLAEAPRITVSVGGRSPRITVSVGGRLLRVSSGLRREHEPSVYSYGYAYGHGSVPSDRRSGPRASAAPENVK